MDSQKALQIVQALADGIDPITGEVFAEGSPYQHPDVVRALFAAAAALQGRVVSEERGKSLPDNAGKAWSEVEEKLLVERFDGGASEAELAQVHHRTRGSIRSRLVRLGKIEP
jgi:hypothetical protein